MDDFKKRAIRSRSILRLNIFHVQLLTYNSEHMQKFRSAEHVPNAFNPRTAVYASTYG